MHCDWVIYSPKFDLNSGCAFLLNSVSERCNKHLGNFAFSVCTVSCGISFFPLQFMALVLCNNIGS